MRDIKFRCWNKETKSFHYWGVDIEGCTFIGPLSGKQPANKYEHQQFTGLRDQNGKEIYEGDILREVVNIPFIDENPYRIVWDDGGWKWKCLQSERVDYVYQAITKSAEIIGNIYENSEPLEVPHDTKI